MVAFAVLQAHKLVLAKVCVVSCSRTVRRLFWYALSAMLCVWSVMMLKHVEVDSSRFGALLLFSVRMALHHRSKRLPHAKPHTFMQHNIRLPNLLLTVAS